MTTGAKTTHGSPMSHTQLKEHAKWLAESHSIDLGTGDEVLLNKLSQNESFLIKSYKVIEDAARSKRRIVPAAVWLLDNFYMLEEQIWLARLHLPKSYSTELPILLTGKNPGYPRVYTLVDELIRSTDGVIDEQSIKIFISSYQDLSPLKIGELWAIPLMARFALIQNARDTGTRIAAGAIDRHNAEVWAEKIASIQSTDYSSLFQVMAEISASKPRLSNPFLAEFARRLQSLSSTPTLPMGWLEQQLNKSGQTLDDLFQHEGQQEACDQVNMSHIIASFKIIDSIDWRDFVENLSAIEPLLRKDPAGTYAHMDFATRDSYRHVIENLAKRFSVSETTVAQMALNMSRKESITSDEALTRKSHIGYYLVQQGQTVLEAELANDHAFSFVRKILRGKYKGHLYFIFIAATTLMITACMSFFLIKNLSSWWTITSLIITTMIVSSQASISVANWATTLVLKPRRLPRLDLSKGIPPELSTIVVVPTMLCSSTTIASVLSILEVNFLGNRDENLKFCLLTDFIDAKLQNCADDETLLGLVSNGIMKLNEKYRIESQEPFYLLHRPRKWNPSEKKWMGYERKRGKIMDLLDVLRGESPNKFSTIIGDIKNLTKAKYIITLDSDTHLPHDAARQLIGAMAHPLNQPVIDPALGRVIEGYAILQPRIGIEFQSANRTWFSKFFSGDAGVDPYTREISDIYQDLFEAGSFIGKGILDVDAFSKTLKGKFPENWILSHDLIESCIARSGLISDVILYEKHPPQYLAEMSRRHRWIRGDWQIAPWLIPWFLKRFTRFPPLSLSFLSRWKIFDNLRRSLVPVAMLFILLLSWTATNNPLYWSLFILIVIALPTVLTLIQKGFIENRRRIWILQSTQDFLILLAQPILTLILLPHEAWRNLNGILVAIFRMAFGRRHLLEWKPAHEVDRDTDGRLFSYVMSFTPIIIIITTWILAQQRSQPVTFVGLAFLCLWAGGPLVAWSMSQEIKEKKVTLSAADRDFLLDIAQKTWSFFDAYVTKSENWLPPDNVQYSPNEVIAHRTSPTNIGFYLLSVIAAYEFALISLEELFERIDSTFITLDKLERFNGHFYNWYDTRTLIPMTPQYVSTVDSGNLTASLYTLAAFLEQTESTATVSAERLKTTAQKARDLGTCDFYFLYNKSRRLLAIGYNAHDQRMDSSHYDLLASEARLASIFGIALGQLPKSHWYALGRLMNRIGTQKILLSWSGSMFEYLMPSLILPEYEGTLLSETHKAAVNCQIAYGKARDVPWGFSESGYFATDLQNNFQYRAFGVPGLGFKRGLGEDLVVAPYASMLAMLVHPVAACENLKLLSNSEFMGRHGFYEAVDYTKGRIPPKSTFGVVKSFMAHHQGMGLLGLAHYLLDKPLQRAISKSPLLQSVAILLEEGKPKTIPFPLYGTESHETLQPLSQGQVGFRILKEANPLEPSIQLLSNGNYHVMIGAAGEGYSTSSDLLLNRYRTDYTQRPSGIFCYIRNISHDEFWSPSFQPTQKVPDNYEVVFSDNKVEFKRRDGIIETHMEISISPEHNVEIRRLHITNRSQTPVEIEIISFMEIALNNLASDEAHPAFSKLFLKTEIIRPLESILCERKPRDEHETAKWAFHTIADHDRQATNVSYETDRHQFIGRGHSPRQPKAISDTASSSDGYVLDPIFSIRKTYVIQSFETLTADLIFGEARDRSDCISLTGLFREKNSADRVFEMSWAHAEVCLQQLNISPATGQLLNKLAGYIVYPQSYMRHLAKPSWSYQKGQSGLWGHSISGDLPITLIRISNISQISLLRELVVAHTYWRRKGLLTDLVIFNEDESSYRQRLQEEILGVTAHTGIDPTKSHLGRIFIIRPSQIGEDDAHLIQSSARVVFNAKDSTSLANQLEIRTKINNQRTVEKYRQLHAKTSSKSRTLKQHRTTLPHLNAAGTEYQMVISREFNTPLPWVNVLANPCFGTVISERGAAYTWYENAHEFRLTPWSNDPVCDPSGECYYIQDTTTGEFWSPTPWPASSDGDYFVRHGFGYSVFEHICNDIRSETWVFVDSHEPLKYVIITVHNSSNHKRNLSLTATCDWVLGEHRSKTATHVITDFKDGVIFARNPFLTAGGETTAFFGTDTPSSWSTDRLQVYGELGTCEFPKALTKDTLQPPRNSVIDPCAALRVDITLAPDATKEIVFVLGAGENFEKAQSLSRLTTKVRPPAKALREVRKHWQELLTRVKIETPDPKINALANGWLLYQTISSRLFARSGFYQSSGAFGFRDQLQDVMSVVHHNPSLTKSQILRCAKQQFIEGDVLHWWHPPSGKGIRTHFSDDFLWLPFVTAHYIEKTGDQGILNECTNFIEAPSLKPGQESLYGQPNKSEQTASIYEHCLRAIRNGLKFGPHGLPLIGCGDWNDGMNLVGINGRGESVWLAFFLYQVLDKFQNLADFQQDAETVRLCIENKSKIKEQLDLYAWDGNWYIRAFFDDGTPLGSHENSECKIDLLPQAWAILSGLASDAKANLIIKAVEDRLIKRDHRLIQLFDPPFENTHLNPGYIKNYPPGVRENGGQYTHAAIWFIWATAKMGRHDEAWDLLEMINPLNNDSSLEDIKLYKVEPYVIAADVYSKAPHAGRGGWTWYTGAAGWMYQLILEGLLGIIRKGEYIHLAPKIKSNWDEYSVHYLYKKTCYHIKVARKTVDQRSALFIDNIEQTSKIVRLVDDEQIHNVLLYV
jgi:cyclic beta-1,2-glucan synthetase